MIVPMKKVSLVVLDKNREASLNTLRGLGVVHLEKKSAVSDSLAKLLEKRTRLENAQGILMPYQVDKKAAVAQAATEKPRRRATDRIVPEPYSSEGLDAETAPDFQTQVLELGEERKTLQEQLASQARERSRIEKWGNFNPRDIKDLAANGLALFLYELPLKDYESLSDDVRRIVLGATKASVFVLVLDKEMEGQSPFVLPELSLSEIDFNMADIRDHLVDIEKQLGALAFRKSRLDTEKKSLDELIEFERARAGMDVLEDVPADYAVSWLSGFVPQEDLGLLKRAAAENGWALLAEDPGPEDEVPTKLKNNKLASLIYPLTDFLEVVPGYNEVDISGFFLFFFCVFFGMIFGDAGYGAILLLAAIVCIIKTAKKGVPAAFKLFFLLGLSNFVWGVLTCTWFAIDTAQVPQFLRDISLPLISNVTSAKSDYDAGIVQQNLMILCFSLALLHLSIGHILVIIRSRTLKLLGDVGSVAMLVGMYFIILSLIASNEYRQIPMMMPMVYLFGGGFVLNFMFANYDGSFGKSVLESCKNIISVILGIANVFSDIMSYIRLWAVGLAGGAIAATVNAMAGPMLGHLVFFIFGIVLVVFGHGLNLVLNVLSVLVHGVRLNTLEFSGHVGLTWSGFAYKPFAKRIKNETT
ncbi:V-type ATP synthase subunit I [Spirochaetia bacterium]|nr:V-type ATP synthase subunit I [Spirochaetia bacterium]